jgi:hypothetical protein
MKSSKNQFALMPKSPLKHWGFIDKLRAPNIEVWQIFLAIKVITYFYPVNYVTYNTLCFILPELPNGTGHTKKRPRPPGAARDRPGTGNNARRIGILFKSNFCRNYIVIQVYNCFK